MTGSPKLKDFKSYVPRICLQRLLVLELSPQETLETRMLFMTIKFCQVWKRCEWYVLSFSTEKWRRKHEELFKLVLKAPNLAEV